MFKRFTSPLWSYVLSFGYIAFFYKDLLLTNQSFPGGDAKRALYYADLAKNSEQVVPLWEPFSALGRPFFADPELMFYWFYAQFINVFDRTYYPISYNLSLLFLLLVLVVVLTKLFMSFGVKRNTGIVVATILCCGVIVTPMIESGRINSLIGYIAGVGLIPAYRFSMNSNPSALIGTFGLVGLSSIALFVTGYYALIPFGILFSYMVSEELSKHDKHPLGAVLKSLKLMSLILVATFLFSAWFLIPLVELQIETLGDSGGVSHFFALELSSFPRLFLPFYAQQNDLRVLFPYVSPLLLLSPLMLLGFVKSTAFKKYWFVWFVCGIYLVLSMCFSGEGYVSRVYRDTPILSLIRWGFAYSNYAVLVVAVLTCLVLDALNAEEKTGLTLTAVTLVTLYGFFLNQNDGLANAEIFFISMCFLFSLIMLNRIIQGLSPSAPTLILASALVFQLSLSDDAFNAQKSDRYTPRVSSIYEHKWAANLDSESRIFGERQYCSSMLSCPPRGGPLMSGVNGFSMYMSDSMKNIMEDLYGIEIEYGRPHWIPRKPCNTLNELELKNSATNYLFCRSNESPPSSNWTLIGSSEIWNLWKAKEKSPFFRAYVSSSHAESERSALEFNGRLFVRDLDQVLEITGALEDKVQINLQSRDYVRERLLVTSLPYNDNWVVSVNGEKAPKLNLFGKYLAFELPATNDAHVVIHYSQRFFVWGMAISITFLVVFIIVSVCFFYHKESKKGPPSFSKLIVLEVS